MSNRLAGETSPYLLQHADNPVDWYPWSAAALERAAAEDKPIFLSIGYAACHWCHVMERESFTNPRIAAFLNEHYVSIKVDREERPDLDQIYMHAVMALRGGQGGWPLSAFLTPDQQVFYGGTYWPPEPRHGLPGFEQVLQRVHEVYRTQRVDIQRQAEMVTRLIQESAAHPSDGAGDLSWGLLAQAAVVLERHYDPIDGGFGGPPKFPHAMDLALLLRLEPRWRQEQPVSRPRLREIVHTSLRKMADGGIDDHLAGGFARYSVDASWTIPHFEKMLYDNAQLARLYADAYRASGAEEFADTARATLDYLLRERRDPRGGFYCSEDADSDGAEGRYYVWTKAEIEAALGGEAEPFCRAYGVTAAGNFEGANVLVWQGGDRAARQRLAPARARLAAIRQRRVRPASDDKIIASWNALAIDALAAAGVALQTPEYIEAATACARFVWHNLRNTAGELMHCERQGTARQTAFLDDYGHAIDAFLTLYQATWDSQWVARAAELAQTMVDDFADHERGGFFYTSRRQTPLIARVKDQHDHSLPSGNAIAATALLRLALIGQESRWLERASRTIGNARGLMHRAPTAAAQMLVAADLMLDERKLLAIVVEDRADQAAALLRPYQRRWSPSVEFAVAAGPEALEQLGWSGKRAVDGKPTLYECELLVCRPPRVGLAAIEQRLAELSSAGAFGRPPAGLATG